MNSASAIFNITIVYVDEVPPYLEVSHFTVQEGSRRNLTRFDIKAEDPDTTDDLLVFKLYAKPKYGRIQLIRDIAPEDTLVLFNAPFYLILF